MDGTNLGIITLLPVISFLIFALVTKKCISALLFSGVIGYIIYYKTGFLQPTLDALIDATTDWDNNWIVVICLLFGCLVQLLRESKGAMAIGELARKYVKSQKQVMMLTWLCGIIIFVDDYLSILVTANTILPVSDEKKTPREMLCYIINTTSAPVCVIIPVSAWVVYFSGIFGEQAETKAIAATGTGVYYHVMPYFFYAFLCVIFVPLVIMGIVPKLGGIKKAYERVEKTGMLWPESSNMMNIEQHEEAMGAITDTDVKEEKEIKPHLWAFILPMAVVIGMTLWKDDILWGVTFGIITCFVLFVPTKMMSFGKFCDCCYNGLVDMLFIAAVLIVSLFYRASMDLIGMPNYVIEAVGPMMSAALLPAIAFVAIGLLCFATSNIWSIPAVTVPIVAPLAVSVGASLPLTLGAVISAAVFGAQACFYSDVTLLSASACKISNLDYAVAQLPYIGIVAAISFVGYVAAGFIMI
ncbi:MAG: sodium:proton antiporter [Firmicutes bacterium]|nr:sodium:proton antiporter [Bacillota bacterium]